MADAEERKVMSQEDVDKTLREIEGASKGMDSDARDEFRKLVSAGRKYAFGLLNGRAVIVVEKHTEIFPLADRGWDSETLRMWVDEMNEALGLSAEEVKLIDASSVAEDMKTNYDPIDDEEEEAS